MIAEVGPGGDFMKSKHTKSLMKSTAVFPKVANRGMRAQWEAADRPDAQSRARAVADGILSRPNSAVWSGELEQRIRDEFPGIVAGEHHVGHGGGTRLTIRV